MGTASLRRCHHPMSDVGSKQGGGDPETQHWVNPRRCHHLKTNREGTPWRWHHLKANVGTTSGRCNQPWSDVGSRQAGGDLKNQCGVNTMEMPPHKKQLGDNLEGVSPTKTQCWVNPMEMPPHKTQRR